jgi:hypothetical protein
MVSLDNCYTVIANYGISTIVRIYRALSRYTRNTVHNDTMHVQAGLENRLKGELDTSHACFEIVD